MSVDDEEIVADLQALGERARAFTAGRIPWAWVWRERSNVGAWRFGQIVRVREIKYLRCKRLGWWVTMEIRYD